MKTQSTSGTYNRKDGSKASYDFEYPVFETLDDAIETLGEDKLHSLVQRMVKVDANNVAREKAKVANGDSTRKVMSEGEKAKAKEERAVQREIAKKLREKGITTPEQLASILG